MFLRLVLLVPLFLEGSGSFVFFNTLIGRELHDPVSLVLTPDEAYMPHAGVTATSIMLASSSGRDYVFYVYYVGMLQEEQRLAWEVFEERYPNAHVLFVDGNGRIDESRFALGPWGVAGLLRVTIPEIPDFLHLDKVIYLDCDVIAYGDIAELWDMPMDSMDLIAGWDMAPEYWAARLRRVSGLEDFDSKEYINSGILVMDLARLRQHDFTRKALDWLQEHNSEVHFPDQSTINAVLRGHVKILYDSVWFHYGESSDSRIKLMQYAGSENKPWRAFESTGDSENSFLWSRSHYHWYRQLSPWAIPEKEKSPQEENIIEYIDALSENQKLDLF